MGGEYEIELERRVSKDRKLTTALSLGWLFSSHRTRICPPPLLLLSRRTRHTTWPRDWSSDVCSSDLVAGAVRRVGVAEVPPRVARPVAAPDGPRLRRHLLLTSLRSGHAARGDDGRARRRRAAGQGAVRRDLVVLAGEDGRGVRDPERARCAAADPPAVLLAPQPLDRGRAARRGRRAGRRLHRLLAARTGDADGQVPRRGPAGLPRVT